MVTSDTAFHRIPPFDLVALSHYFAIPPNIPQVRYNDKPIVYLHVVPIIPGAFNSPSSRTPINWFLLMLCSIIICTGMYISPYLITLIILLFQHLLVLLYLIHVCSYGQQTLPLCLQRQYLERKIFYTLLSNCKRCLTAATVVKQPLQRPTCHTHPLSGIIT